MVLRNIWKRAKGLVIRDLDTNLFVFKFSSDVDKDYVLNKGPWVFDGHILLIQQMIGLEIRQKWSLRPLSHRSRHMMPLELSKLLKS